MSVTALGKNLMLDALKGTNPTTPITHVGLFTKNANRNPTGSAASRRGRNRHWRSAHAVSGPTARSPGAAPRAAARPRGAAAAWAFRPEGAEEAAEVEAPSCGTLRRTSPVKAQSQLPLSSAYRT